MKKLFTLLTMLLIGIGSMWADTLLPTAVVGTTAFQATSLTTGASSCSINEITGGNVIISPNSGYFGNNSGAFTGTLVIKINVPETPKSGFVCEFRSASGKTNDGSQGLYLSEGRVLATSWTGNVRADGNMTKSSLERTLTSGEHTIIFIAGNNGGYVIVDSTDGIYFSDSGLKRSNIEYKVIEISADYAPYITEVHYFSDSKSDADKTTIFTECGNHMHASQQSSTTANVTSGKTLILDKAVAWTSLTGTGTVLQEVNIATTVAGSLPALTLKATAGTLTYTGSNLNGTTLDGVILGGSERITTSNTVNIKNLAGNNLNNTDHLYAFVGGGTINFYGVCDLTKKSDGTVCNSANIGYGSSANVIIKAGANVTAGVVLNSVTIESNAPITVEAAATLTAVGSTHNDNKTLLVYSTNLTNNGTINLNADGRKSIVSVLSGSGTLNVASGSSVTAPSIPNTTTLTGAGDVVLTTFPSSTAPTLSSWIGTFEFPTPTSEQADLAAIFNAWGNANSTIKLHSVSGWLPGGDVNPTLNIMETQTLTIRDGSSNTNPVLKKITGAGTLEQTWSGGSGYTLNIATLTDFTGTLKGTNKPIVVEKLVCANSPDADALLLKTSGTVTLEKLYIGLQSTKAYSWDTKTVEGITGIYVTSVNLVQLARESAENTVYPYNNFIGTGVGKYTIYLGDDKYNSIEDFLAALDAWSTVDDYKEPKVTINQPTSGFYRFHIDNKYMCGIAGNDNVRTATETNNDASTIFYLNEDNYLISYLDGYGFNYGYCKAISPGIFNKFDFSKSTLLTKYNIHSNAGTGDSQWSDRNIIINTSDNKLAEGQGTWAIEPVTSLPFTFNSNALGYATFNCPVDVQVPDDVDAYVCRRNGTQLTLFKIENITTKDDDDNDVPTIPANTPVLLYNSNYTKNPTVQFKTTTLDEEVEVEGNGFYGTVGAKAYDESYSWYSLQKSGDNMGFFKKSSGTLNGFKAWVRVSDTSARQLTIVFDGESDPTGIVEALGLEDENVEIFDLNGRKLSSYQKGINIVNGKKVMVP